MQLVAEGRIDLDQRAVEQRILKPLRLKDIVLPRGSVDGRKRVELSVTSAANGGEPGDGYLKLYDAVSAENKRGAGLTQLPSRRSKITPKN